MTETTEMRLARIQLLIADAWLDCLKMKRDLAERREKIVNAQRELKMVLVEMRLREPRPYSEIREELVEEGLLDGE